ncbi:MAG: hypothetical protein L0H36_02400 [bacterium]|nr:hypothetical protein [bacterium]
MTIKQKILTCAVFAVSILGLAAIQPATTSYAAAECGGVKTAIINCDKKYKKDATKVEENPVWGILIMTIKIMSVGVGILAVGGLVWGGILYASAGDRAEQVKQAITIITNVVIGLLLFVFLAAIVNFLVPGGVFQ